MLASPTGLVWRLTRGGILGWAVGGLLVGILATSLSGVIDEFTQDNQAIRDMIAQMAGGADTASATVASSSSARRCSPPPRYSSSRRGRSPGGAGT